MHYGILQGGRVLKMSPSPIQGYSSILDSDSVKSGTHLLLTDNNICHNKVWPIHFLHTCRKPTVDMEALCPIMSGNALPYIEF